MSLILPPSVAIDLENSRKEKLVDEALGRATDFFRRLQEYDPNLDLVVAHEGAHEEDERLLDGFWHIRRLNQGINDSYMPITTPTGEWAEPSEYHLDLLKERDMWRDGAIDAIYEKTRARERASAEQAAAIQAEQMDTFAGHYKAIDSPGVLMSDIPWSYRAGARRG